LRPSRSPYDVIHRAHRQTLAAHDGKLPLGSWQAGHCRYADPKKVAEKLGTAFAAIDWKPPNLSGNRQKTDEP
jgi:hypothetical protein